MRIRAASSPSPSNGLGSASVAGSSHVSGSVLIGPDQTRAVVTVCGEVDCSTAATFRQLLDGAAVGRRDLVLDLSGVTFMDASGLGVLAGVAGQQAPLGGSVELRSASELIYRICMITRLTDIVHVEPPPTGPSTHGSGALDPNGLDHLLQEVARLARAELPGAYGVSITLPRFGRLRTVAATDPVVLEMDHDQYDTGEGPCLDAAALGRRVRIDSLAAETNRWPEFVPKAEARGTEAILSLPLFAGNRPFGALTVYAGNPGALPDEGSDWVELFAAEASTLTTAAYGGAQIHGVSGIRAALQCRETIAQAQGVVMALDGVSAEAAHAALLGTSRRTNRPLRVVAADCLSSVRRTTAPAEIRTGHLTEAARSVAVSSEVSPRQPDGTVYLRAEGDWTGPAAGRLRTLFDRAYQHRPTAVIADLAGVGEMDRASLDALVTARRRLAGVGCSLELQNLPPHLCRLLERTGLDPLLTPAVAPDRWESAPAKPARVGEGTAGNEGL